MVQFKTHWGSIKTPRAIAAPSLPGAMRQSSDPDHGLTNIGSKMTVFVCFRPKIVMLCQGSMESIVAFLSLRCTCLATTVTILLSFLKQESTS